MKNSYSNIFAFNKKILNKTIKNLNNGNVAGLPTETVYGLAGNAYSKISIQRIYKLKERPSSNPLIIHYYNFKDALDDIEINENFIKLYKFSTLNQKLKLRHTYSLCLQKLASLFIANHSSLKSTFEYSSK